MVLDADGVHVGAQVSTQLRRPTVAGGRSPALLDRTGVPWILTPAPRDDNVEEVRVSRTEGRFATDHDLAVESGYLAARSLLEELDSRE